MVEPLVPRWEWRSFAPSFPAIAARLEQDPPEQVRLSDEIYILSRQGGENTKIRYGLMDVKLLLEVNPLGLERWRPFLKFNFPLEPQMVAELHALWEIEPPPGGVPGPCSLERLLAEVVAPHPELATVAVTKRRIGYLVNDCFVERAELTFDGVPLQTVAVEHEDPGRVWEVLREWGVTGWENVNYLTALKRHLGWLEPAGVGHGG